MQFLFVALIFVVCSLGVQAEPSCPENTVLMGKPPPDGVEQYCALANGKKHGFYKHWYANGQLMELLYFKDGKEHGSQTAWWPNGQMMMRGESVNGKRYREFEYWDAAGNPRKLAVDVIREEQ